MGTTTTYVNLPVISAAIRLPGDTISPLIHSIHLIHAQLDLGQYSCGLRVTGAEYAHIDASSQAHEQHSLVGGPVGSERVR